MVPAVASRQGEDPSANRSRRTRKHRDAVDPSLLRSSQREHLVAIDERPATRGRQGVAPASPARAVAVVVRDHVAAWDEDEGYEIEARTVSLGLTQAGVFSGAAETLENRPERTPAGRWHTRSHPRRSDIDRRHPVHAVGYAPTATNAARAQRSSRFLSRRERRARLAANRRDPRGTAVVELTS